MPPKEPSRGGLGSRTRSGQGYGYGTNTTEPGNATGANPLAPGLNPYNISPSNPYAPGATNPYIIDPTNPYVPGATNPNAPVYISPYAPGTGQPVTPPAQRAASTPPPPRTPSQIQPRPDESPRAFERRRAAREQMSTAQAARRARVRAAVEAASQEAGGEPKRKVPRNELVDRLNVCSARVTRSAVERDEELSNCPHCARGKTWPRKCHGGDECVECEARGIACIRGNKRHYDKIRARQLQGVEPWRSESDQCRQCKSKGVRCCMPFMKLPGPCDRCQADGLVCDITPLPVRRCPTCHWEHKCIECARNHLRCDGETPCFVCVRKGIECVGLKPDGSCPDIPMSTYGTGLPPCPFRTSVLPTREDKNWPPPSGRLEIPDDGVIPGVPGGYQVINFRPGPSGVAGPAPPSGPDPGPALGLSQDSPLGQGSSPAEAGPSFQDELPLEQDPGFDPNSVRTSLYNPFDDGKPPCSHCAADPENRICDNDTPCWECSRRNILEEEDCRTSKPCELCFMNEMPCDAGSPCQHCMFLGFGAEECRPEGTGPQLYFPNDNADDSEDEPYIHLGGKAVPEFQYSCAFCVAYGFDACDPRDRTCVACMQHGRTALQCRFEERCNRCIEMDVPCDGKMPCTMCATADGLTSMMCLGRGDTTMPGANNNELFEEEGDDIQMGDGGDYPALAGFGYEIPLLGADNPFALGEVPQEYIDPATLLAGQGPPGQSVLPRDDVPRVPPNGFFYPPALVREDLLPHYRIRTDVYINGRFDPQPGSHVDWRPWIDAFRCKETLENGTDCLKLPAIPCDGGIEHGDEEWCVCEWCRKIAEERTAYLMAEIEEKKNLFCCDTCSQAQMNKFNAGTGFENMETLVDYHCDCDAQMRAWLCYACRNKVIHAVGNRMISTREKLTRDSDNAILCPRCGVEPGNKDAAYTLAKGVAKCSSCWSWINYAK